MWVTIAGLRAGLPGVARRIVWHNGGTGGFRTLIAFDPDARIGVVVLTNSAHGADDIGFHLLDPALQLAPVPTPPNERVEMTVSEETLEAYVGEYELARDFSIVVTLENRAPSRRRASASGCPTGWGRSTWKDADFQPQEPQRPPVSDVLHPRSRRKRK